MVFWAGILTGGLFTWLAIKIGFYETWTMLFNIIISIYIAVFLAPVIIDIIPAAGDTAYGNALTLTAIAIGAFLILYGITYTLFTGQFKVPFPKIFDNLFAGLLGFLAGFFVLSFAAFIIILTPLSQNRLISELGFNRQSQQANLSYICWWCDLVNSIVSSPGYEITSEQAVNQLLNNAQSKARDKTLEQAQPDKSVGPDDTETNTREKGKPTPLSENNFEDF